MTDISTLPGRNDDYVIAQLFYLGHFWNPATPDGHNVKDEDLDTLTVNDEVVKQAARSMSRFDVPAYARFVLEDHGREPAFDGEAGPSVRRLVSEPRCWVPDFAPPSEDHVPELADRELEECILSMIPQPATGVGNWKGCHNIGNFHSAIVNVNRDGMDNRLKPVFEEVLQNVQHAYDKIGLRFAFAEDGRDILTGESVSGNVNIDFSFVGRSPGWIGLAIIGQNQGCQSNIWCRYLSTYRPSSMVNEWTTLIKHELGHNCGRGQHTTGGVMNPSIVRGLPLDWPTSDPSYDWLERQFGGEPIGDDPDVPEPKPDGIEARVKVLERYRIESLVNDTVHQASIDYLLSERNAGSEVYPPTV